MTLNNGICPVTGTRVGIETGDARNFETFEELYEAFLAQIRFIVDQKVRESNYIDRMFAKYTPAPFLAVVIDDCISGNARGQVLKSKVFSSFSYISRPDPALTLYPKIGDRARRTHMAPIEQIAFINQLEKLQRDFGAQYSKEFADPFRMRRPGRSRDKIAIHVGIGEGVVVWNPLAANHLHIRTAGRVGRAGFAL